MPKPAKKWTPELLNSWVHSFIETHGRIPNKKDMDSGGPGANHRKAYGGVAGILTAAGISIAAHSIKRFWDRETIKHEVQRWAETHAPSDRAPTKVDLIKARKAGQLPFHPETIYHHYQSVEELFAELGLKKDEWTPQECIQFARLIQNKKADGGLRGQVAQFGQPGKTPPFDVISSYYSDIREFIHYRVRWENWQPRKDRAGLQECWLGYSALALARADGDTRYIVSEINAMHEVGIGPAYDNDQIAEVFLPERPGAAGIHMQDRAVEIYDGIERAGKLGRYLKQIHPIFMPELRDIGLLNTKEDTGRSAEEA